MSKASDSASKSGFVLARAHTAAPSSSDASNYGRMKGESCRDMVLMRGSSSGGVRRLSSEKDGKNDPSGISMTPANGDRGGRGGRDHCNDLRDRSFSDQSVLSMKASDRVTERYETSLFQGSKAPLTAETSCTPHGRCTESQATAGLSPTPLTRTPVPLTSQSFNIRAATSDVPYPDTEGRMDSATSLADCLTDSHSVSMADQTHNQTQTQTRSDALVCTGHVRPRVQTAPSCQSGAINGSGGEMVPPQVRDSEVTRGPGSLVISGRGQGVSGSGTNIARHRAASHKLNITHNYRCMYQSQRMKSSVYKRPESEGLGFIVKVLNYNTSLPQKPKELIKK